MCYIWLTMMRCIWLTLFVFDWPRCVVFVWPRCVVFDWPRCVVFDWPRCVVFDWPQCVVFVSKHDSTLLAACSIIISLFKFNMVSHDRSLVTAWDWTGCFQPERVYIPASCFLVFIKRIHKKDHYRGHRYVLVPKHLPKTTVWRYKLLCINCSLNY